MLQKQADGSKTLQQHGEASAQRTRRQGELPHTLVVAEAEPAGKASARAKRDGGNMGVLNIDEGQV